MNFNPMSRPSLRAMAAVLPFLGGCASIVSGQNQSVSVEAVSPSGPVTGAQCQLTNNKGTWFVSTPGSTMVQRSFEDLAVRCEKAGYEPNVLTFKSATKGMAFGNILFGGLIGASIDVSTGAAYDYPTLLTIPLANGDGTSSPVPEVAASTSPASFGLQAGDTFEYVVEDRYTRTERAVTRSVTVIDAQGVKFGANDRIESDAGVLLSMTSAALGDLEVFEPPTGWLPVQPTLGQVWQSTYVARDDAPRSGVNLTLRVAQKAPITTRAGTFEAWVVEVDGYAQRTGGAAEVQHSVKMRLWVDVATRRPVRFESDIQPHGAGSQPGRSSRERVELVRVVRASV